MGSLEEIEKRLQVATEQFNLLQEQRALLAQGAHEKTLKAILANLELLDQYNTGRFRENKCESKDSTFKREPKVCYIRRCIMFIKGKMMTTTHLNVYMDFGCFKQDVEVGIQDKLDEILRESEKFLNYVKKVLTTAHKSHNQNLIDAQNALVLERNTPCPFCKKLGKYYGAQVNEVNESTLQSESKEDSARTKPNPGIRRCIIKKDSRDEEGFYFATGCLRKIRLIPMRDIDLLENMSLDATKARIEFDWSGKYHDTSPEPGYCCGHNCGFKCGTSNPQWGCVQDLDD